MIGLIQRVSGASVHVGPEIIAEIGPGLLVLVGVQRGDAAQSVARLAERVCAYRVFPDGSGRMNLSVCDIDAQLLLVPQFTLAADTAKGNRPGFSKGADPADGAALFDDFVSACRSRVAGTQQGRFGADMQVHLINDGPVTFWLEVPPG